jgi:hypothetical protein
MATVVVSTGLCSAIRPKVLTALRPYGFKDSDIQTWGEGHYYLPEPPFVRFPDSDIWVRKHVAAVTVSAARAKWCERLLWQCGAVYMDEDKRIDKTLNWTAPPECKAGEHGTLGRGTMPTPWSEKAKAKQADWLGGLFGMFRQETPARKRAQRRERRRR